jgi:hypothetical protein
LRISIQTSLPPTTALPLIVLLTLLVLALAKVTRKFRKGDSFSWSCGRSPCVIREAPQRHAKPMARKARPQFLQKLIPKILVPILTQRITKHSNYALKTG